MITLKKDLPKQLHGMWAAGLFNIVMCLINLIVYYTINESVISLSVACFSLVAGIVILTMATRMAQAQVWKRLKTQDNMTSELS